MTANAMIRVLVRTQTPGANLLRTLVSLSAQDVGPARMEIVLLSPEPELHDSPEARKLYAALGLRNVDVQDSGHMPASLAMNKAAAGGRADTLALVAEGARLHRRFLSRCQAALGAPGMQAAFCCHTSGAADGVPAIRRRPFRPEMLARMNAVGPAVLVRREVWRALGGLRPGLRLALWDFWLRLLMDGGGIAEVPELLASTPPAQRLPAPVDGQAKAMLVVSTPGAFEQDVCRWALALLRGDAWAGSFEPGLIPGPRDVAAMSGGLSGALEGPGLAGWGAVGRRTA